MTSLFEKCKGLDSRLTEIMRLTGVEGIVKPSLVIRDLVLKDSGGMPNSRITLLGDAAHPMAPCEFENALFVQPSATEMLMSVSPRRRRLQRHDRRTHVVKGPHCVQPGDRGIHAERVSGRDAA